MHMTHDLALRHSRIVGFMVQLILLHLFMCVCVRARVHFNAVQFC